MLLVFNSALSTVNVVLPSCLFLFGHCGLIFSFLLRRFRSHDLATLSLCSFLWVGLSLLSWWTAIHLLFSFYYLEVFAFLWVLLPYNFGFPRPLRNQINLPVLPVHFLHHTSEGELKSLLMSEKEEREEGGLTQHPKNKDPVIWSHHFMANRWENNGNSETLYFLGLQNHCRWWLQP